MLHRGRLFAKEEILATAVLRRDYSLTGPEADKAVERGLDGPINARPKLRVFRIALFQGGPDGFFDRIQCRPLRLLCLVVG